MQGYQGHIAIQGGYGPGVLNPYPKGRRRDSAVCLSVPYVRELVWGWDLPAVPVSPGYVRPLHTYPPSHRRRR